MYLVTLLDFTDCSCAENKCKSLGEQVTIEGSIPFIPFLLISLSNPDTCFAEFIISSCTGD